MTFPSVTLCNANRIHCGNLQKLLRKAYCNEHIQLDETVAEDLEYYMNEDGFMDENCSDTYNLNHQSWEIDSSDIVAILIELYAMTYCSVPDGFYHEDDDYFFDKVKSE